MDASYVFLNVITFDIFQILSSDLGYFVHLFAHNGIHLHQVRRTIEPLHTDHATFCYQYVFCLLCPHCKSDHRLCSTQPRILQGVRYVNKHWSTFRYCYNGKLLIIFLFALSSCVPNVFIPYGLQLDDSYEYGNIFASQVNEKMLTGIHTLL